MPVNFIDNINKLQNVAITNPTIRAIAINPVFTAIIITLLLMFIIYIFNDTKHRYVKIFIWTLVVTVVILFWQRAILKAIDNYKENYVGGDEFLVKNNPITVGMPVSARLSLPTNGTSEIPELAMLDEEEEDDKASVSSASSIKSGSSYSSSIRNIKAMSTVM